MPRAAKIALLALLGVALAATAVRLFPRAFPAIALDNRLTQPTALAKADSFLAAHHLADSATQRAVQFDNNSQIVTYVDLFAGGTDSVNALIKGRDAAPFIWQVRAFEPGQVHEATVTFAPSGQVIGFQRRFANADTLPELSADSAKALAQVVLKTWTDIGGAGWKFITASTSTKKESGRVDHTVTFERTDRKIGDAPIRADIVIAGNEVAESRRYTEIPESFTRRYAEMRSSNDSLALAANLGILVYVLLVAWTIRNYSRAHALRWRAPVVVGVVVGVLLAGAGLNGWQAVWFSYDTAMPAGIVEAIAIAGSVIGGLAMGAVVTLTLVAAEAAARHAFPERLDWWQLWRARGTRDVAAQVGGGYVVAAFGFAYVALFYLTTRKLLGWWVPSELLDDPNQISTPAPWITGIGMSLQAGVWEETLFRALPLSLLSLWARNRPNRSQLMAGGVVVTALIFGFAHANYPSWPPYSRGVELFLEASIWAVIFLRVGLLTTVLAHFIYDLVLFSLFTATGTATSYRVSAAIAIIALAMPGLIVAWRWVRQRGFAVADDSMRFGAWRPTDPTAERPVAPTAPVVSTFSARDRQLALVAVAIAFVAALAAPEHRGAAPAFTASRDQVVRVADSMLVARGGTPDAWHRLTATASDTMPAWRRFLRKRKLDSLIAPMSRTYAIPGWWTVRYVHTAGPLGVRAEEWRVRVLPDGRPLDARHIVADSSPGDSLSPAATRDVARKALVGAGYDASKFVEAEFDQTKKPHRMDATVAWTDTTVHLPDGASARAYVSLAGSEALVVRRGVQLPESFRREERARSTKAAAIGGVIIILLLVSLITASIYASKARPQLVTDHAFGKRDVWIVFGTLATATWLSAANSWPSAVFSYDTATPWLTHLLQTGMILALSGIGVVFVYGLLQLTEMLRRRAGIPAAPPPDESPRDLILAGAGLAGTFAAAQYVPLFADRANSAMGDGGTTALTALYPVAEAFLSVPNGIIALAVGIALPPLLLAVTFPTRRARWTAFGVILGITIIGAFATASTFDIERTSRLSSLVGLPFAAAAIAALVRWGTRNARIWWIAAAVSVALSQLRGVVHEPTSIERFGAFIALVASVSALVWLSRWRPPLQAGTRNGAETTQIIADTA